MFAQNGPASTSWQGRPLTIACVHGRATETMSMDNSMKSLGAGLLLAVGIALAGPAQAMPAAAPALPAEAPQVENVARVCDWRGCYYVAPRVVAPYYAPRYYAPPVYRPRYRVYRRYY